MAILSASSLLACTKDPAPPASGGGGDDAPPVDAGVAPSPDARPDPPPCIDSPSFDERFHRLVRGGTMDLPPVSASSPATWQIEVSDPRVLRATGREVAIEVEGLSVGTATIAATRCGRTLRYEVTVVPAARIEVRLATSIARLATGRPAPLTQLTAIAGSVDLLEVTYLDAAGGVLAGTHAATYAYEGGVAHSDGGNPEFLLPALDAIPRDFPAFAFTGPGRIVASGDFKTVAIDVATTPRPDHLTIASLAFLVYANAVIGQTADGVELAGVTAAWSVAPDTGFDVASAPGPGRDFILVARRGFTGSAAVTARVGSLTATTKFEVP